MKIKVKGASMNIYDMLETFDDSLRVSTKKMSFVQHTGRKKDGACERWMKCLPRIQRKR